MGHEKYNIDRLSKVWAGSFTCWYLVIIISQIQTASLFPEDYKLYYALNPITGLIHENAPRVFELIGLFAMGNIVANIQQHEKTVITS